MSCPTKDGILIDYFFLTFTHCVLLVRCTLFLMVYFWTYAHPSYCPSDLLARGFTAAIDGLLAAAPGPLTAALSPLAAALGPEIVLT